MSTFNDIRTRFQVALNEAAGLSGWKRDMRVAYQTFKPDGRWIEPKNTEIIRAEFDIDNEEDDIEKFLAIAGIKSSDYELVTGNYSGTFNSWGIQMKKEYNFFGKKLEKGKEYAIINALDFSGGSVKVIGDKDLTPDKLGLSGTYQSKDAIVSSAKSAIERTVSNPDYQNFCTDLIDAVQNHNVVYQTVDDIHGSNKDFTISEDLTKYRDLIDAKSVKAIEKDFGEILGGIFIFNIVVKSGSGLKFPTESNLELVDFFFNGLAISSKAGKGAKASASGYISAINNAMKASNTILTPEEIEAINNVLKPLESQPNEPKNTTYLSKSRGSSTFSNTVDLFNIHLGSGSSWDFWIKSTGLNRGNLNRDAIIQSFVDLKESGNLHKVLSKFVAMTNLNPGTKGSLNYLIVPFLKAKNEKATQEALDKIMQEEQYDILIGTVLYACSKELQQVINQKYSETITSIINKSLSVKQLYLDMKIKNNLIKFSIRSMETGKFLIGTLNGIDSWSMKALPIYMEK
jgi:hypothetical protein